MHIADVKITNEWVTLSSFTTIGANDVFYLINSSPDMLYAVEADATPANDVVGVPFQPGDYLEYQKGAQAELYIRNGYRNIGSEPSPVKISNLTINKVG